MATEAPVNITPPECGTVISTAADSFVWQPDMHVIRPKSAKGRTRPSLHKSQGAEVGSQRTPPSLPPAIPYELPSSQKPGACAPKSPNQGAPEEVPELPQQVSFGGSSSLNKYPVLPSINRKTLEERAVETVAEKAGSLQLSGIQALYREESCTRKTSTEDSRARARSPERKFIVQTKRQNPSGPGDLEEPSDQEPRLLLAVRSPSGRRFVRHFRPTDNLQTVVAVAEHKNKASYRHCSVETMEVPRRRFSDLTKSLQECRIPHKSVLGISQEDGEGWP
ncbi:UBX domain-containing protein 10 [Equus asinus]|uniref:UBX domain-containing protein 10 n=2 Tax=Equus asinus TaxID=9793 RepID=A0A9L0IAC8_EQUAS|nr:UBX domain-containing protein 10 [Equus asinus]XP_014710263.2 UBX domain-containing protein 10 [Equus asinus]XP_014710264.2 UBX domain-containing protein 10 [Equus asinus]XP_044625806.1 UBX domain-containing protein 10 [Equus asinus]XP_046519532.1 UBX domain-containing protein 10 [Equus quagga]XP_046519533.1 UBX domain-containing protein 10 [Equus quagga]XP_046519534.1 UBX domain-containing protein 10 [Equus quagga]XP_046519535.1 UBX domain-containing protein 10 [Equus quagga]